MWPNTKYILRVEQEGRDGLETGGFVDNQVLENIGRMFP